MNGYRIKRKKIYLTMIEKGICHNCVKLKIIILWLIIERTLTPHNNVFITLINNLFFSRVWYSKIPDKEIRTVNSLLTDATPSSSEITIFVLRYKGYDLVSTRNMVFPFFIVQQVEMNIDNKCVTICELQCIC